MFFLKVFWGEKFLIKYVCSRISTKWMFSKINNWKRKQFVHEIKKNHICVLSLSFSHFSLPLTIFLFSRNSDCINNGEIRRLTKNSQFFATFVHCKWFCYFSSLFTFFTYFQDFEEALATRSWSCNFDRSWTVLVESPAIVCQQP